MKKQPVKPKPKKLLNHSTILAKLCPGFVLISQPLNCFSKDKKAAAEAIATAKSMQADQKRNGTPCQLVQWRGMGYVMRSVKGYITDKQSRRTGSYKSLQVM